MLSQLLMHFSILMKKTWMSLHVTPTVRHSLLWWPTFSHLTSFPAMRLQVLNDFHQDINTPIRSRQWQRANAS